ncbi:hypothetical protein HMPREF1977_0488 [Capnocytophaga ochracea F0287]|uniref:Uncharacterized protein n=1 Tax=Capnocytophaga ochracea F0287 TaxID=873517 RepID=E4MQ28_CAPOC|nr:hypothetical protein HMPREF1977_0488 [Capnocytophaga ochracea F0287]EJF43591.1 hypothetical protein HMPREF1319_2121 [Capnocytophaga ochracea str. Holt 25]
MRAIKRKKNKGVYYFTLYVAKAQENVQAYNQAIKTLRISKSRIDKDLYTE